MSNRKKEPQTETALTTTSPTELIIPQPNGIRLGDLFSNKLTDEHEVLRGLVAVDQTAKHLQIKHLQHIQKNLLWEQGRDESDKPFSSFSKYLEWVEAHIGVDRSTIYRGFAGAKLLGSIGIEIDELEGITPARMEKLGKALVVNDPETGQPAIHPNIVAEAAKVGIDPLEKVRELINHDERGQLGAVNDLTKGTENKVTYSMKLNTGKNRYEITAWQDELVQGVWLADARKTSDAAVEHMTRKLNILKITEE